MRCGVVRQAFKARHGHPRGDVPMPLCALRDADCKLHIRQTKSPARDAPAGQGQDGAEASLASARASSSPALPQDGREALGQCRGHWDPRNACPEPTRLAFRGPCAEWPVGQPNVSACGLLRIGAGCRLYEAHSLNGIGKEPQRRAVPTCTCPGLLCFRQASREHTGPPTEQSQCSNG